MLEHVAEIGDLRVVFRPRAEVRPPVILPYDALVEVFEDGDELLSFMFQPSFPIRDIGPTFERLQPTVTDTARELHRAWFVKDREKTD